MVLPTISKIINPVTRAQRPMFNNVAYSPYTGATRAAVYNQLHRTFWKRFRQSPELYGIVNIMVTDIMGDRPTFTSPQNDPLGRNKRYEAERFWRTHRMKETLKAILFDMFITGDGYGWAGVATSEARAKAVKEALHKYRLSLKEFDYHRLVIKAMQDEDLKKPRKFDYIPSSTTTIDADLYDVKGYVQNVAGETIYFTPEEVLHFRLNTFDGRVNGFTPLEPLAKELALLYFVKGNMLAYMQNGGKPDILFTLENGRPNQDSFNNFKQQLQSFKQLENAHGHLLATGKTQVQDLSFGKERDMEYQNLALWTMSGMLFAFGIPISRVPFLIGKAATGGDSGGLAEAGYQSMISEKQDLIEDIMNYQFFEKLGWHMHLSRHYKQDEVREANVFSQNADTVTKLQNIYRLQGKRLRTSKINELLKIGEEDLEDAPDEVALFDPSGMGLRNQNMKPNEALTHEPDNRKRADTKRNVANRRADKGLGV